MTGRTSLCAVICTATAIVAVAFMKELHNLIAIVGSGRMITTTS